MRVRLIATTKAKQKRYKTIPVTLYQDPIILLDEAGSSGVSREVPTILALAILCFTLRCN